MKLLGWKQNGSKIETPVGIHMEDYFDSDGAYLGPDENGVEPIIQDGLVTDDAQVHYDGLVTDGARVYGAAADGGKGL